MNFKIILVLGAPWIIYFITLNPIMIVIGIYMFVASIPVMIKKNGIMAEYLKKDD